MNRTCSFEGCGRPHYARTLCHAHYWQVRRTGTAKPIATRQKPRSSWERDEQGRKRCTMCDRWADESEFVKDRGRADGLAGRCKACNSSHMRAWKFGLRPADLDRMIHNQDGACALCPARLSDGYCVDHDHACCPGVKTCGQCVRGLLCDECNKLIGKLEKDRERLSRLLTYIGVKHG